MLDPDNKSVKSFWLNKEFDLRMAITVLKRSFYMPMILMVLTFSISFIYLRYTKPIYESTAVIQRSSQDEGKRILDIDGFETENNLSEDVELLKSSFLLEKALKNLNLEVSYYAEGQILTEEKYLLSSYHITLLELKDSSLVGVPIFVKNLGEQVELSFKMGEVIERVIIPIDAPFDNEHFNLIFKVNNEEQFFDNSGKNRLFFVFNNYEYLTSTLHPRLEVFALNPDAKTIQISFKSNNHRLSTDIVSSLINTFFQYNLEKKRQSSANILDFINSQLDTVFIQLKESEIAIQSYRDSNSVNDPEFFTTKIMERSNELQAQVLAVDFELELIEEVHRKVQISDRIEIFQIIPAVTGTDYENLLIRELEELHELLVKREDYQYSMTDDNDNLKKIERSIDSQTDNIFRILMTIRNQLRFKRKSLQNRIDQVEGQLYGIPEKEMELSRLNRMFSLNEKYYALLIEKKTQYAISKAGFTMDNMVLHAPTDAVLISPNREFVYVLALVIALLLSIIYLLIRYLTFNDIHEPEELKKLIPSEVGFLGTIPKIAGEDKHSRLIVHLKPKSAFAESYRHIRSNLQFILKQNVSNVIAVSSSISGEGKTFAAVNLGGIIAMSGKKVLVIDLDLRKPKIHHAFEAENKEGMSSILVNSINWKACVRKSELEGFDFITAGPIPPNPSELIIGSKLNEIIENFKDVYDIVMVDNPPVGIVSDGISVMNNADCPIYIFRANYSKRFHVQRVKDLVDNNQIKKLFVILNAMESSTKGYGEYYTDDRTSKRVRQFWKKG